MAQASIDLHYEPQPKQVLLHTAKVKQVFFGGAAGGSKSHGLRWDLIKWCLYVPGLETYLFRRTLGELQSNHIRPLQREIPIEVGEYSDYRKRFEFRNGSAINVCYCEKEMDVTRYQGAEMHVLAIDEASHLTEFQITYLRTRARLGGFAEKVPEHMRPYLPRIVLASNPGGPGHSHIKMTYIDPAPAGTIFTDATMEEPGKPGSGWPTIFIQAGMKDNKYLDPGYAGQFTALAPELAKALRDGDWDVVMGQAVHNLSRTRHMLRPFDPPAHWTRMLSIDWGTAKPFSIGWYAVSEGALLKGKEGKADVWMPAGAVIRYAEWYGWSGKSDKGCRKDSRTVAREIVKREAERKVRIDYRVADSNMWAKSDGPSVQENMFEASEGRLVFRQSQKDRKANYAEILSRLAGNPRYMEDGEVMDPMFFVTSDCVHFWRTVPSLTLDDVDPDKGPDSKQEDHCVSGASTIVIKEGKRVRWVFLEELCKEGIAEGTVWTKDGWSRFVNLGMTLAESEVWGVTLKNDRHFVATGSHKVYCADGRYRRLDELTYNDYIVNAPYSELNAWRSIFRDRRIGFVASITKGARSVCTGLFGSISTALSRLASMFTTRMATIRTTISQILNCYPLRSTSVGTCHRLSGLNTASGISSESDPRQLLGTNRKPEGNGTLNAARKMLSWLRDFLMLAWNAGGKGSQKPGAGSTVEAPVIKEHSAVGIRAITRLSGTRPVYNLHVPEVHNFVINGGVVVHNCYDEVVYLLRSRPFVTTEENRRDVEEWRDRREARGVNHDPYATG